MVTCCEICGDIIEESWLPRRVWNRHRLKSEQYYLEILGNKGRACIYCGEPSKFNDIAKGYHSICNKKECELKLRSDSAKASKQKLKLDEQKYSQFKIRTSKAVEALWKERARTGEDTEIRQKIFVSQKATISKMSADERSEKFGWMNSPTVSCEKKREVWEKSLGKFHENLTAIERKKYYEYCRSQADKINRVDAVYEEIKLTAKMNNSLSEYFNLANR